MVGAAPLVCGHAQGFGTEAAFFGLRRPERLRHKHGAPGSALGDGYWLGHIHQSVPERGVGLCALWQASLSGGASAETLGTFLFPDGPLSLVVQLGRY